MRSWEGRSRGPGGGGRIRACASVLDLATCGDGLEDRPDPLGAISLLRSLPPRYGALFAWANREALIRRSAASASPGSVLEGTAHVRDVLAAADARLRELLGEDVQPRAHAEAPRADVNGDGCGAVLDSVTAVANRLARTITAATALDWEHTRAADGTTASELVGQALAEAVRHLHESEAALGHDTARGREPA